MDLTQFGPGSPGTLVELSGDESAFVPEALPPSWEWPSELWPALVAAHKGIARLDGITQALPSPKIVVSPLQQREALRSSSLEGTYASPRELLLFDLEPAAAPPESTWREVANYNLALQHGAATIEERGLSFSLIGELHKILLTDVRGRHRTPGKFRTDQVYIGSDRRFIPPPVTHLPGCLDDLRRYLERPDDALDPLVRCFVVHYQFETIHPFFDGNGRVGRLLLSLMIQAWCKTSGPWLYLSAFFDRHKDEYIDALFRVSAHGAWSAWLDLCLRATIAQADDTIERCTRLLALWKSYRARVEADRRAPARCTKIVEGLFDNAFVRIADLSRRFGVTYPTANNDGERLIELGILRELPNHYPRTLYAPEVFDIAFAEPEGPPSIER